MSQFEIYFTTPHSILPGFILDEPARILGRCFQFSNADLDAPMGAAPRQFDFGVSIYDDVFARVKDTKPDGVNAYDTFVYVEWRGHPVFWGPILDPEWDGEEADKVTFRCYSQKKRYEAHFLRAGDLIWSGDVNGITEADKWKAMVPIDYRGIRLIRDAVEVSATQDYAPLGLRNGPNTAPTSSQLMELERGQQCRRAEEELLSSSFAPEVLEVPLKINEDPPYYAELQTALKLGSDKTQDIILQGGYGLNNLEGIKFNPGGKIVTHAHVLDRSGKHRETRVNVASGRKNGVWVDWVNVDFAVTDAQQDAVLGDGVAQTIIDHYGVPPNFATITFKADDEIFGGGRKFWLEDFEHGDYITAGYKKGHLHLPQSIYRIISTGLKQEDQESGVKQRVSIVPEVTGTYDNIDE